MKYIQIGMTVHRERAMDTFNVHDLEERKLYIYNSRLPLKFEGLCNIAI